MKETGSSEIVEHDLAEGYVHTGQPLDLYKVSAIPGISTYSARIRSNAAGRTANP